jgi:hypothetical protein
MNKALSAALLLSLTIISYAKDKKLQPTGECHKYVSVAIATQQGIEQAAPAFVMKWWSKNARKYPYVCMGTDGSTNQPGNYLLLVSASQENINGVTSTVRTYTNTSKYTFTNSLGYSSSGTITTSTPVRESAEFTDSNSTIFMAVYDSHRSLIGKESHLYSVRSGGDASETLGYNLASALTAINARGRMLKNLMKGVDRSSDVEFLHAVEKPSTAATKSDEVAAGKYTSDSPASTVPASQQNPTATQALSQATCQAAPTSAESKAAVTRKGSIRKSEPKCPNGEYWGDSPSGDPVCVWVHEQ